MEVGAPDTASDVFVSPQPAPKQNTCEAVKPPIPWPTRAQGVMSTDGRGVGERGADCLTWGEALSNGPLHRQEGPRIHSISLAVKECAELTEQLPDLEPIIKGTDMTKVRLGDQCWVWAKPPGGARWELLSFKVTCLSRKVTHNTSGKVRSSVLCVDLHEYIFLLRYLCFSKRRYYLLKEEFFAASCIPLSAMKSLQIYMTSLISFK